MQTVADQVSLGPRADDTGAPVPAQLLPASAATRRLQAALAAADALPDPAAAASHELAFLAALPPLGYVTYSLEPCDDADADAARAQPRDGARPLLARPGGREQPGVGDALDPGAGCGTRRGAPAAASRVVEWAPGSGSAPGLAGLGARLGPDGRLTLGYGGLALSLEAASGRVVALRSGGMATELSTSAVRGTTRQRSRSWGCCAVLCQGAVTADAPSHECTSARGQSMPRAAACSERALTQIPNPMFSL